MPRPRIISESAAGVLISVRLSREIIKLLDIVAKKDGFANRSELIREATANEIEARMD